MPELNYIANADVGLPIRVSTSADWDLSELAEKWQKLQVKASSNSYLNWGWVSAWLSLCDSKPLCIEAVLHGETVGLGLLCHRQQAWFSDLKIDQLWLHRNGTEDKDQIWVEHNDFLLASIHQSQIRQRMIRHLQYYIEFDELYLGLVSEQVARSVTHYSHNYRTDLDVPSYFVNLSPFEKPSDYLSSLSRNTRSQITRSKKLIEKAEGPLQLLTPSSDEEKQLYLNDIARLHRLRWGDTEYGSGFDNPSFSEFHQKLILNDYHNSDTRLYKLQAGEICFGYVYLLIDKDSWKFYLSALDLHPDNRIKVGLLFHTLVIEEAISCGVKVYDFLAGKARYKQSLSGNEERQQMLCLYKSTNVVKIREMLRSMKRFYTKQRKYYLRDDV